jgi:hypothetical protein
MYEGIHPSIIIPSTVFFIAWNAADDSVELSIADVDSCPECGRWQRLQGAGIHVDFRRIRRFGSSFLSLSDSLWNRLSLNAESCLSENEEISAQIYDCCEDCLRIIVKSIKLSRCVKDDYVEKIINNSLNLRHPCIGSVIGVVLPTGLRVLKLVEVSESGYSLFEVVSSSPEWWTPTAKAKAIVGLVMGLRFVHSFGLLHGNLTMNNIQLAEDGAIEITNFFLKSFEAEKSEECHTEYVEGFSGERWSPSDDIQAFTRILCEIVLDSSPDLCELNRSVPSFVLELIKEGQSTDSIPTKSFADIFETLKKNDFKIAEGVEVMEVSSFVNWIEWCERLIE